MPTGRIIKGVGGLYFVDLLKKSPDKLLSKIDINTNVNEEVNAEVKSNSKEIYQCRARGKFKIDGATPLVGDVVDISVTDEVKKSGYLLNIHERKNELIRPKAANIDTVVIVFAAAKPAINLDLLDGFLLTAEYNVKNIEIIICVNKIDLVEGGSVADIRAMYKTTGYRLLGVSARENSGIEGLRKLLKGKTSIVAGPSGVGKSSILNALSPEMALGTGEISRKIERGKHTTRYAELYMLEENTYIADSPGFSSLSVEMIPKNEIQNCFPEFKPFLGKCYFNNCGHVSEPDCAVKAAVGRAIDAVRYERYVKYFTQK